ncbi:hypothetical protein [Brevibacillus laterosporus]|uniref:hypothetical protein n=1 Tax=Brevibacillus laterosporus TaxID=1465 RepID=UPI000E6CFF7E|nr:hypothetical protein [Brevibacillus laterosporus]AYB39701.1 hypothetical protein D5F52_16270 [Brevibacillus laterosporus]MBM7109128.1 hypothetical protein [Brevibacillus laterosporus]
MSSFVHLPLQIGDSLVLLRDMEFVDAESDTFTVEKGTVLEVESMDWNNGYYRDYGYHAVSSTETSDIEICVKHSDYGIKFTKHEKLTEKGPLSACTCEDHECCPDCSPDEN